MKNPKILEVIVSSLQDAIEAQAGGADRLEVVRNLELDGLTPDFSLVEQIRGAVGIPIRVMLREFQRMDLQDESELDGLCATAARLNGLQVDGLVTGYIRNDAIDLPTLKAITQAAPQLKVTFHRAFDSVSDPLAAIGDLKTVPQVDRILTVGGPGAWPARKVRLQRWQSCAAPEIAILAGAGTDEQVIQDLSRDHNIGEIHVGRAARNPRTTDGVVSRLLVAQIKGLSA